jgi:hypothetical protein
VIDTTNKPKQKEIHEVLKRFDREKFAKESDCGEIEAGAVADNIKVTARGYTLLVAKFNSGKQYKIYVYEQDHLKHTVQLPPNNQVTAFYVHYNQVFYALRVRDDAKDPMIEEKGTKLRTTILGTCRFIPE